MCFNCPDWEDYCTEPDCREGSQGFNYGGRPSTMRHFYLGDTLCVHIQERKKKESEECLSLAMHEDPEMTNDLWERSRCPEAKWRANRIAIEMLFRNLRAALQSMANAFKGMDRRTK